jgi:hypothetical protein
MDNFLRPLITKKEISGVSCPLRKTKWAPHKKALGQTSRIATSCPEGGFFSHTKVTIVVVEQIAVHLTGGKSQFRPTKGGQNNKTGEKTQYRKGKILLFVRICKKQGGKKKREMMSGFFFDGTTGPTRVRWRTCSSTRKKT